VDRQVGDLPHAREQRGADLLLWLLLWPGTESETPWTGRSETCPTPGQNEFPVRQPTGGLNRILFATGGRIRSSIVDIV